MTCRPTNGNPSVRAAVLFLAVLPWAVCAQTRTAPPELTLGVVPVFPSAEIHRRIQPLAASLAAACKQPVKVVLARSMPAFEATVTRGELDLVLLNPYHMVMAHKAQGYVPLVREGKQPFQGVLVVRADSPIQRVADLNGKTVAFPSPNAFSASLYMRALLEREHKIQVKVQYARTHSNSFRQVIAGDADAAGGASATLDEEPDTISKRLRVIYQTPQVPSHPLAAHPRVSASLRHCIQQTLLASATNSVLQSQLARALMPNPVAASYVRDYQPLEKLALDTYVVHEAPAEGTPL